MNEEENIERNKCSKLKINVSRKKENKKKSQNRKKSKQITNKNFLVKFPNKIKNWKLTQ